uniref:Oxysterol-binding protein n=1 Tax=Panagrolaimus sp. JU765 TaxID=591449 RepID=A0AC34QIA4_9BILA
MSVMEGPLSKWTNVVHGWQYRWFVLNDDVLCYFTSRDKMLRRQQRGCIRLRGAAIGIDGENNSLFTITVDGKVFHLQGRDQKERDQWVRALERAIHEKSGYYKPQNEEPIIELETKVIIAEKQLQELIEQVRLFEKLENDVDEKKEKKKLLHDVIQSTKRLQSTVDHSTIILRQVQRHFEKNDDKKSLNEIKDEQNEDEVCMDDIVPPITYSSSEDEFFDAASGINIGGKKGEDIEEDEDENAEPNNIMGKNDIHKTNSPRNRKKKLEWESPEEEPDWDDSNEDFDSIYQNNQESELGDVQQQHGSVLMHLLSQVSVGMDLTKVTLPTFILERRSLLEMYADFFAHPDDFIKGVTTETPEDRMISVVRYYLGSFYPARKSGVAKKPYNPILGEVFRCKWTIPTLELTGQKTKDGPFPGTDINQLTFVAEQVSHHPPVSAFYAEHPAFYAEHPGKKISLNAHIWTKSSFLGLSIGVANVGHAVVTFHEYDEKYVITFPNGYGRSIMSTPWIELGGKVEVKCEKTGYSAEIEFLTKPFFGGKPHKIQGGIYKQHLKKPILALRGEWNGLIYAKPLHGDEYLFLDVKAKPEVLKECDPISLQDDRESRKLWRHVTAALFRNKINIASSAKRWIEQRQRDETKRRQETGQIYQQKLFVKDGDDWKFKYSLGSRSEV